MLKKKITIIIGIAFAVSSFIAGCGSNKDAKDKDDVVIWHWMTDRQDVFDELAQKYKEETGISVKFLVFAPSEVYVQKIWGAAQADLLPEVYSPLGDDRKYTSFIKAGQISDLSLAVDDEWKGSFFPKPLEQNIFPSDNEWGIEAGIYGIPIDVNSMEIFYNKDLFKKAGLDPEQPLKTWDEFIEAGKKLRQAGIQPFVSGFGEAWLVGAFAASYEWNIFGKDGILATIKGEIPYTDKRWIRVFSIYKDMKDAGMFASGIVTMVNKDAERVFATEKAAMALNGSWGVNVYYQMNPKLNYGVMLPAPMVEGKYSIKIWGGGGSSFNVNPKSSNKDKAIRFLRWMTDDKQQVFLAQKTHNIPSNKRCTNVLSPILRELAQNLDKTFPKLPLLEDWKVVNVKNLGMQSIIIGEKTPEEVAKEVQEEKKRSMEK
jgi:ABC-type glycerol-3-phosphate transport system substrate-binding protein